MRRFKDDIKTTKPDWQTLKQLLPYLFEHKGRVFIAMACLVLAKLATVLLPIILKHMVDALDQDPADLMVIPIALLLAYGGLRFASVIFGELRDSVFGRITERTMRHAGLAVFKHLHKLELDFHLSRRTGGLSRDIERGISGINFLLRFMVFNVVPTLLEIALIAIILASAFGMLYALIALLSVLCYGIYSVSITEWRNQYIREANKMDSQSNTRAIDSLLNYETVKYFNNETYEAERYDQNLAAWEQARIKNRLSLLALNSGQALIISIAMTSMLFMAANGVATKSMTLGDFVLVNAYLMQLFIPLNFLGFVYREMRQAMTHIERMFSLLARKSKLNDSANAKPLVIQQASIEFNQVSFAYNNNQQILDNISFRVKPNEKLAIVGPSGAGKSTIARLLFRFYDAQSGDIKIDNQCLLDITQDSLRKVIGVVPQDTVLFNDTIYYNIAYGKPSASDAEIKHAADVANLTEFIHKLPEAYNTLVGERGLKLSGGEKQRIAIARTVLKNPNILIFDEATSSLDSTAEQAIMQSLKNLSNNKTTIAIAHRLSTITDADHIIVLDNGKIAERGTHQQLLNKQGLYHQLWQHQKKPAITVDITHAE